MIAAVVTIAALAALLVTILLRLWDALEQREHKHKEN